ncbi:competence protein [Fructobacillus ficulneus]|uniref:Competence protein n=2 Tax=Fructobacillus ficulneus TaxID=157463 RepID=A0A0K8MH31_9LACO|nr:competence protein [Fructobacillus ficulneus]
MVSGPIDEGTPDFVRQRAKLTLLLAQKRVDVDLVAYLYQKGWRLDQIPTWCLLGRQFGLVVPNWHLRLVLILLLMNSAKKCLAISALNQRLERYFHPNYQKDCRQVALVNLYQELEKVGGIKVIDGQIIVKKLPSFVSE